MRFCRFDEDRLGPLEVEEVVDLTPAREAIPAARWPRPHGNALIANLDAVLARARRLRTEAPRPVMRHDPRGRDR